ncbi:MAG: type II toxin-antitoxin system VapC family toxin [Ignavibacteriae bacterium]|nr:type II toxin-antitoxin system VapC family toxin [Ignavibacteriota bacterium]
MKKLRIYVDTSVFGGIYDKEFAKESITLFQYFLEDKILPVISSVVAAEIEGAPEHVKGTFKQLNNFEFVEADEEASRLALQYIGDGIVTEKYSDDALHIALATIHKVDILVSWNFKHIVNFQKIRAFNSVNLREGYGILEIRTPKEVIENE